MADEPPCKKFRQSENVEKTSSSLRRKGINNVLKDFHYCRSSKCNFFKSLQYRSYGLKTKLLNDPLSSASSCDHEIGLKLYASLRYSRKYHDGTSNYGAIYNIEFSPQDNFLIAATSLSNIIVFDPCSQKKIKQFSTKQTGGVNGITFIDERTFSTCSDDTSIMLWDIRNTDEPVNVLRGHTNWVKDMSFNRENKHLLSSAFDETIMSWNLNECDEDGSYESKVLLTVPFITRTDFSSDFSKMVVSTTAGCLLIFNEFNEENIENYQDLLEVLSPGLVSLDEVSQKLNKHSPKLSVIIDFPESKEESYYKAKPLCFGSIKISPSSKYLLSRYTTRGHVEWSTLHGLSLDGEEAGRLVGCVEEPNVANEYIKEPSFSADERVICSPYGHAIRVLSINPDNHSGNILSELSFFATHRSPVLCCKFANTKMLLASGCMSGQINFYQPNIY